MDLKELKQEIPYQWRVQSFSKFKPEASCVAYIDARDVMELLDKVCGPENWQSDYKSVDGQMFAGIGILVPVKIVAGLSGMSSPIHASDWVWKWDTGSESNIEAEKGQASDSFKRAAVKWGIGRFLYDLPIKKVATNEALGEKNKPYVVDAGGQRVWDITKHINGKQDNSAEKALEATIRKGVSALKPQPPKVAAQSKEGKKKVIMDLLLAVSAADPTNLFDAPSSGDDFRGACQMYTGLELVEENYPAIIEKLTKLTK